MVQERAIVEEDRWAKWETVFGSPIGLAAAKPELALMPTPALIATSTLSSGSAFRLLVGLPLLRIPPFAAGLCI